MPIPKSKPEVSFDLSEVSRPLTKSRLKMALDCPTKLFYTGKADYANSKVDDPFLKALAKGGFQVGKLAQIQFGPGTEVVEKDYVKALTETESLLSGGDVTIFEAAFRYQNHFIKADVVKREGKSIELIEVKAKGWPGREAILAKKGGLKKSSGFIPYLYDIAYQTWVVRNACPSFHITPFLGVMNKDAKTSVDGLNQHFKIVRQGKSFFVKTDGELTKADLGSEIILKEDVREFVELILSGTDQEDILESRGGKTFEAWLHWLAEQYHHDRKVPAVLSEECKKCEYRTYAEDYPGKKSGFDECWKEAAQEAPASEARSFDLWGGVKGIISEREIYFLKDLVEEDIKTKTKPKAYELSNPCGGWTRHERRLLQIEHAKAKKPKSDALFHKDLKTAMEVPAPWHFIDFETAMAAIPFSKGKRPYEQIAFQFSHHVMREDGHIEHRTQFLRAEPGKEPNFEFVRALKNALSTDLGTVFRYAAHENTVLNQIHDQLLASAESDRDELVAWIRSLAAPTDKNAERFPGWKPVRPFVDLLEYVKWFFWAPSMGGSNSIKVAFPAILAASPYLQKKYGAAIYGRAAEIKSLNFDAKAWVSTKDGQLEDPYSTLGPIFPDMPESRSALDDAFGDGDDAELRDGGAAMMAYCRLQFSDLNEEQRKHIESALLRYCELDTLAMVLLWEGWLNVGK